MPQSLNARGNKDCGSDKRQSGERFERKEEFRGKHNDRGRRIESHPRVGVKLAVASSAERGLRPPKV